MEPQNTPNNRAAGFEIDARTLALLDLKHEMEQVHARLVYLKLLLKLDVRCAKPK